MKNPIKEEADKKTVITTTQLREMATTKTLRDILKNYIEHEKIPSVRSAWVEYFIDIKKRRQ